MSDSIPKATEMSFAEVSIGQSFSIERTFTTDEVLRFAHLSGDFSPLHIDPVYSSSTEFGGCVVHGVLLASLFSQLVGMRIPGKHALYLGQDLSFRKPVLVGETVRASVKVTAKNEAMRTIVLATEVRNREDKIVVSGSAKVKVRDSAIRFPAATPEDATTIGSTGRPVALVTGASRGIGAEIARTLGARGIAVAVNYFQSAELANRVVQTIVSRGGVAIPVQADVRQSEDVQRMVEIVKERFGGFGLLVNCAIGELGEQPVIESEWAVFQSHLEYQVKAVLHLCQAAYRFMKTAGSGAIVNVLSQVVSGMPPARMAPYVTAKHALLGFSKALAAEWAEDHIRVNMVSPGLSQTELTQHYHDRIFKLEASRTPLKRIAQPTDIANAVAFLLSEEASFLTGANLFVTGGQVMS
jgi:3-oxoacyl-[acyl-carrier protein] reductase